MRAHRLGRPLGWTAAGVVSAAILSGAALALVAERQAAPVLLLDLGQTPPAAPAVAALSDPAPVVMDEAPDLPAPPAASEDPPPETPAPTAAPAQPRPATALAPPATKLPPADLRADLPADLAAAPPPPDPKPEAKPKPKPKPDPKPETESPDKPAAEKLRPGKAAVAGATAPDAGAKASGGAKVSPATYAKAVMKKVRATKKKTGAGKGTVTVGFSIAADGSLAGVKVLKGSGNAALDAAAAEHIQRSAPFPAVPDGVTANFSFEFVGK